MTYFSDSDWPPNLTWAASVSCHCEYLLCFCREHNSVQVEAAVKKQLLLTAAEEFVCVLGGQGGDRGQLSGQTNPGLPTVRVLIRTTVPPNLQPLHSNLFYPDEKAGVKDRTVTRTDC